MKPLHLTSLALGLTMHFAACAHAGIDALHDGPLGLHPAAGLKLTTGKCADCASLKQALWYFPEEIIAAPSPTTPVAGFAKELPPLQDAADFIRHASPEALNTQPPLIWIGSKEVIPRANLAADGKTITLPDGSTLPFKVTAKLSTNRSYYDSSSVDFLASRPIRLRGETRPDASGTPGFVARTVWPLDFSLPSNLTPRPLTEGETLKTLVKADNGGASQPFLSRLVWQRAAGNPGNWDGHATLGLMLNGAQGDDDEAHGGHFAVTTGRFREDGDWSRWMVYNFYNLGSVSEKGIVAAPTPMDKYMFDLNNGQSWYRPSYMLVAVLKKDRVALDYQAAVERTYNHFYRHDLEYQHSRANCAGISKDVLATLGWNLPARGHEPMAKAIAAYFYVAVTNLSLTEGRKIYDYLLEESTRLYPAATFDALGDDLLQLVQGKIERPLTAYETALKDDVEAIYYVRIPQAPSSRAFGLAPVYSFDEYMHQAPADRSQWKIVPVDARPFPDALRDGQALKHEEPARVPLPVAATALLLLGLIAWIVRSVRRLLARRKAHIKNTTFKRT